MRAHLHSPTGLAFVLCRTSNCAAGAGVIFSGVYMRREPLNPPAAEAAASGTAVAQLAEVTG
jgi:hypothetical protein